MRDIAVFRLVDMFTACTIPAVKEEILRSFCSSTGNLRVVIATIAFGMGLDCPDVRRIIHWGPSEDTEQYLQETGRAGRDGEQAVATLYITNLQAAHSYSAMKEYCRNTTLCRRQLLLNNFDFGSGNADVFECKCKCCDM